MAITLILTAVAFKFAIADSLPKVSYFTVLDKYMLCSFIFLYLIAVENFVIARLAEKTAFNADYIDEILQNLWLAVWGAFHVLFAIYVKWTVSQDD